MTKFSLIVLSKTDKDSIFKMNVECFNTFIDSAKKAGVDYEIILIESNVNANYNYTVKNFEIITPVESFNFHKFLNIGVEHANGDYFILSNNDVVFNVNWLKESIKVMVNNPKIVSSSPLDPKTNKLPKKLIENNNYLLGYQIQKHLTGWCIVIHKSVFNTIKKLDERFEFYYADNDYAMQLQKYNIKHALITKAIVHHLESGNSNHKKEVKKTVSLNKKLPNYIIKENWTWVLENEKMMKGLIQFHDKWGSRRIIKLKLKVVRFFSNIGLGFLNRVILFHS
ncbi:glycosyltransferase family 2 protein [Lacinutrix sp. Hel_I_90]|uniref:glycosyltransferase family 2 protein n=1 Tax=Lacinutrix sp. Hel_I_90 TaxID=1249999 RepID=UPI0005CAADF2|nr:glycosyltransferase [Lacinutrix sp. Hel_I_90]